MKLEVNGATLAKNATGAELERALEQQVNRNDAQFILAEDDMTYLQGCFNEGKGFYLEYQIEDTDRHYTTSRNFTLEEVKEIAIAYLRGDTSWRETYGWSKMEL